MKQVMTPFGMMENHSYTPEKKARHNAAFEVAFPTFFAGIVIGMIIADLLLR